MPRLTSKGQVTVPVSVRYALELGPGDNVVFTIEDGRGVFRKATALDGMRGWSAAGPRAGAHALERLLVEGDDAFVRDVEAHRQRATRVRLPDAVVLDIATSLVGRGESPQAVADVLRNVLAERTVRVDHPAAVRSAIDALGHGADPLHAYALARG
jgi:AbrB family looped-hinge helix DNA binding protein